MTSNSSALAITTYYRGVSFRQWKLLVFVLGFAPLADFRRFAAAVSKPFFTFATNLSAGFVTIPLRFGFCPLKKREREIKSKTNNILGYFVFVHLATNFVVIIVNFIEKVSFKMFYCFCVRKSHRSNHYIIYTYYNCVSLSSANNTNTRLFVSFLLQLFYRARRCATTKKPRRQFVFCTV